jgi:NADH-ubiquinone oxidoreductase chain 6
MLNYIQISDLSNGFSLGFLNMITIISILSGILIIISKNPIVSVLYLIALFANISCYLIFIGITFIGISYLLVYVGAVSILFLFILMLINIRVSELISDTNNNIPLAILAILAFFVPIGDVLPDTDSNSNIINIGNYVNNEKAQIGYVSSSNWDGNIVDVIDIMSIGNIMYTSYSM